mmetsp:Transcript_45206/g.61693  ORF Transcript_45206/g.61693 Transcript_45206/m.61693 type:complete len:204 (+) Transcript_45206:121-732(+)
MGLKAKCGFAMAFFAVAIPSDEFVMNGGKDECEFAIAPFPLELLSNDWFPIPTGGLSGIDRQTLIGLGCILLMFCCILFCGRQLLLSVPTAESHCSSESLGLMHQFLTTSQNCWIVYGVRSVPDTRPGSMPLRYVFSSSPCASIITIGHVTPISRMIFASSPPFIPEKSAIMMIKFTWARSMSCSSSNPSLTQSNTVQTIRSG